MFIHFNWLESLITCSGMLENERNEAGGIYGKQRNSLQHCKSPGEGEKKRREGK